MTSGRFNVLVSGVEDRAAALLRDRLAGSCVLLPPCGIREVVQAVLDRDPDILVLDVGRAEAPSVEAVRAVRAVRQVRPELPIIVLSATSSIEDAAFIEQGVFYYTVSPDDDELAEAVQAAGRSVAKHG